MTTIPYTNSVNISTLSPGACFTLPNDGSLICIVMGSGPFTPPPGEILNVLLSTGAWNSVPGTTQVTPLPDYQVGPA